MATEFTVRLEHKPGTLAQVGRVLGDANVNIKAFQTYVCEGIGTFQFVVDDSERAIQALEESEVEYTTRPVLVVNLLDQPGSMADVALVMADAGINLEAAYVHINGYMVLAVDDVDGATQVAKGMDVF